MKGMQLRITLDLLLQLIGLDRGQIQLGAAAVDVDHPDVLILVLRGEDERLPEATLGQRWPERRVICRRDETLSGVRGEIST